MNGLAHMLCSPCPVASAPMPEAQCQRLLQNLPGWELATVENSVRLGRTFVFKDFSEALAFTNRVGGLAEAVGHHPELITRWGEVRVSWWTHAIQGVHLNDFIMAARSDALFSV